MKTILSFLILVLMISFVNAEQPCKNVKQGMTKADVLKLAGPPTTIDTLGWNVGADNSEVLMVLWQYGDPEKDGNQRVEFTGDAVDSDVIADGKKYDELIKAYEHGDFPKWQLQELIKKLNKEACK